MSEENKIPVVPECPVCQHEMRVQSSRVEIIDSTSLPKKYELIINWNHQEIGATWKRIPDHNIDLTRKYKIREVVF